MKLTLQKKLEACPLFAGVEDLTFLTRCLKPLLQRLEPGQRMHWPGSGYTAVVVEGRVQAEDGPRRPGTLLGMEEAVVNLPGPAVTAIRPTVLFLLPVRPLFLTCSSCCPEHQQLVKNATTAMAKNTLSLRRRQALLLIRGTRARLYAYLSALRDEAGSDTLTLPCNRQTLAAYLNLSRPSLSRELCTLRDEGVLEFYRETVRILKPEALKFDPPPG